MKIQQTPPSRSLRVWNGSAEEVTVTTQCSAITRLFFAVKACGGWPYNIRNGSIKRKWLIYSSVLMAVYLVIIIVTIVRFIQSIMEQLEILYLILQVSFIMHFVVAWLNIIRSLYTKEKLATYLPTLLSILETGTETLSHKLGLGESDNTHYYINRRFGKALSGYICSTVVLLVAVVAIGQWDNGLLHKIVSYISVASSYDTSVRSVMKVVLPASLGIIMGAQYGVIFLLGACVACIRFLFADLNQAIRNQCRTKGDRQQRYDVFQFISERHLYLSKFVEETNEVFGTYLIFFYTNLIVQNLCYTYLIVYIVRNLAAYSILNLLIILSFTIHTNFVGIVISHIFANMSKTVQDVDIDLYDIMINKKFSTEERKLMSQLLKKLKGRPVVMSANDYFVIDKTFIVAMIGVYITYVVVLLQM